MEMWRIKTMIDIKVKLENAEVRGIEEKTRKAGNTYLLVNVDDERGKRSELLDYDTERKQYYKRGVYGDFLLHVEIGKYSKCVVEDFTLKQE